MQDCRLHTPTTLTALVVQVNMLFSITRVGKRDLVELSREPVKHKGLCQSTASFKLQFVRIRRTQCVGVKLVVTNSRGRHRQGWKACFQFDPVRDKSVLKKVAKGYTNTARVLRSYRYPNMSTDVLQKAACVMLFPYHPAGSKYDCAMVVL